jgi:hypothetical protein
MNAIKTWNKCVYRVYTPRMKSSINCGSRIWITTDAVRRASTASILTAYKQFSKSKVRRRIFSDLRIRDKQLFSITCYQTVMLAI